MINQLLTPAAWASPLGLGVFLICFGIFVFLCSAAGGYHHRYDKKK